MCKSATMQDIVAKDDVQLDEADAAAAAPDDAADEETPPTCWDKTKSFYVQNSFMVNVIIVIAIARAHASLTTKSYEDVLSILAIIAVIWIFLFTGLGLRTRELVKALKNYKFNAFVQLFNLGLLPVAIWATSRVLIDIKVLSTPLANGVAVCAFLPMTVNMVIVLTKSSGGDEAAAVFNSACGNLLGVFVTPAWVQALLGSTSSVSFAATVIKLCYRVLAPLFVGQLTQYWLPSVAKWAKKHKPTLKKLQEHLLTFIVYVTFVKLDVGVGAVDVVVMIVVQCLLLVASMGVAWFMLGLLNFDKKLRVMGLFGCTHKTVAMGVPLITAIYEGGSQPLGLYLLPLLVWHPSQLVIGSFLAPRLLKWVGPSSESSGELSV